MIKYHDLPPEAFVVIYRKKIELKVKELIPDKKDWKENTLERKLVELRPKLTQAENNAAISFKNSANVQIHTDSEFKKDFFISDYHVINRALNRLLGRDPHLDENYIINDNEFLNENDQKIWEDYKRSKNVTKNEYKPLFIIGCSVLLLSISIFFSKNTDMEKSQVITSILPKDVYHKTDTIRDTLVIKKLVKKHPQVKVHIPPYIVKLYSQGDSSAFSWNFKKSYNDSVTNNSRSSGVLK
jgi:hypothetical protein